jgi:hypothetical protein
MFLALLGAGLFVMGALLAMCPVFISYITDLTTIYIIAGALAFVGAVIFAVALFLWWLICHPSFCSWVALAWKICFLAGMTAAYYMFCMPCFPIGLLGALILLGAAAGFWAYWVAKCDPDQCTRFNEMVILLPALDIITLGQFILGGCVLANNLKGAIAWAVIVGLINAVAVHGQQRNCDLSQS